jgi:aminoglycoside phosphotransferase (APT) family kinase protein
MAEFPTALTAFLADTLDTPVILRNATIVVGGASLETWAVTAEWEGQRHELIVRRDTDSKMSATAISRTDEFALLQTMHQHGVFVARPLFVKTTDSYPYFVVERREGTSIGVKVVREPTLAVARERLLPQLATELAKIHTVPVPEVSFLPTPARNHTPAQEALALLRATANALDPSNPIWAFGLRWLERNLPPPSPLVVVHGDYRIGNVLVTAEGLNGILDWEFAHRGDPAEDVAWLAVRDWRFGNLHLPMGGIGTREAFLTAYYAAGGSHLEAERLRWWEILGNLKWAIFCLSQVDRHLSGKEPNIEYAALGRRAAEMEWELLRLIEGENEWGIEP